MNFLKVLAKERDDGFVVFWTNSKSGMRGAISVSVPLEFEDRAIIAELYATQHLLEVEEAVGNNIAGCKTIKLIVSRGAIKKLRRKDSAKHWLAAYSLFLTTRFKDSPIAVEKDEGWIDESMPITLNLDASMPIEETVEIHGFGKALLTAHVVERYAERTNADSFADAWRKLRRIAAEEKVQELEKNNPRTRAKYSFMGKTEGRYFLHTTQRMVFVVAFNLAQQPTLVTTYKVNE